MKKAINMMMVIASVLCAVAAVSTESLKKGFPTLLVTKSKSAATSVSINKSATKQHPSIDDYSIIVEKNIFGYITSGEAKTIDTRPIPTPPIEPLPIEEIKNPTPAEKLKEAIMLTGIVEIGDKRKAVFESIAEGPSYYVGVNDEVMDFTVKEIQPGKVALVSGEETIEMTISHSERKRNAEEELLTPAGDDEPKVITPEMLPYPQRGRIWGTKPMDNKENK